LAIIALAFITVGNVEAQVADITLAEAKTLVAIVLRHQKFPSSSRYCQIESMDKGEPFVSHYYAFAASCDFPNTAATSPWGEYLVSPRTGDVLGLEQCRWFRYSELQRLQKQIMFRTHATHAGEAKYREHTGCAQAK
jgi:hypothetical protein